MSNAKLEHRDGFRPKLIALSVAACFSLSATHAAANPTGGTVNSGSATFANSGNTLTITNTANAIINWQSFSIGVNEITRFLQSSGSSAVLNRVVGANGVIPQSVIDGILSSNGRVFLLNSSGIVIGANARIDVAGFVASSLNLSDADFLAGRMRFTETPGAGGVSNAGVIDTTSGGPGGRVFLVGPDVQNSGIIRSPQGEIILAAGKSVELVSENSPFVTVNITADSEQALNLGQLLADSGHIGMFGALVRQSGVIEANSAVVGANGEIRLVATKNVTLDAGSVTTANGPSGGNITLQAQGGTNLIYGTVEAKGSSGQGGTIEALGVRVGLVGNGIIDASGDTGGGTVLVGGDYHGANPNIQNAQQTIIGTDGVIRADAGTTGDGGRVIVWSDEATQFSGSISARGGVQGGDGGFVETSGNVLQAFGSVDTSAPNGKTGNWLLDPTDIYISVNGVNALTCLVPNGICFNDAPTTSSISPATINNSLFTTSVTIQAHHDIVLQSTLTLQYGGTGLNARTFTAQAGNNIDFGQNNIVANGTNVVLHANDPSSLTPSGTGSIISAATYGNISTSGGSVDLSGFGITVGNISTTGGTAAPGAVTMQTTGDLATGSINASSRNAGYAGGSIDLFSSGGKVTVNGSIDTSGALGTAGLTIDGSSGGDITITSAGTAGVTGAILTSGGNGANASGSLGGLGGSAGSVFMSGGGDAFVQGNITARGGNGASGANSGALPGLPGSAGGAGGSVVLTAGGNVTVATIDVGGGTGGAGAQAAQSTASNAGLAGGPGGGAGVVELGAGQSVTVYGSVLAVGGTGGAGGAGIPLIPTGGAGGVGGLGGLVIMTAGSATTGTIRVDGGLAGAGGAYGGVGGTGGDALAVLIYGSSLTLAYGSVITAYGGAGSVGGVGNGAAGGKGGNGGNGGDLLLVTDSSVASSALSVLGGAGGAGGAGTPAGAAGLPGLDGLITIGGTFSDIGLASNTVVASTNQAGNFAVSLDVPDNKIKKDDKKGAAACK
jgi:filamentous hemagglutinin family protein